MSMDRYASGERGRRVTRIRRRFEYAAVVYLRILRSLSKVSIILLTAKTKVAPIKTISVPRLELNAIVLLTRLLEFVQNSLNLKHIATYGWSDSSVALAWLHGHPSRWNSYVANRVSEIQTRLPSIKWNHVPSKENPLIARLVDCRPRNYETSIFGGLALSGYVLQRGRSTINPKFNLIQTEKLFSPNREKLTCVLYKVYQSGNCRIKFLALQN